MARCRRLPRSWVCLPRDDPSRWIDPVPARDPKFNRVALRTNRTMKLATGVAFLVVFGLLARVQGSSEMGCMDESGNPVDWWAALKYPDGSSYSYADSRTPVFKKSREVMADENSGALSHTLSQIY